MTTEAEDTLAALAGSWFVRLGSYDRARVRATARGILERRHALELHDLQEAEAKRLLERREQGLW